MFRDFDYGENVSDLYVDFDYDKSKTLSDQIDILKEDLIQIQYKKWIYNRCGPVSGIFKIYVTKNYNVCTVKTCKNIDELIMTLRCCIDKIQGWYLGVKVTGTSMLGSSKDFGASYCFVAGALVSTEDGFKPIEDIQVCE